MASSVKPTAVSAPGELVGANVFFGAGAVTLLATLEGFPLRMAVVDMIWGMALCTSVSAITYLASARMA